MLVVYCHSIGTQNMFGQSRQNQFYFLGSYGAIGVDIFFVISGFVIAYIASEQSGVKSALTFLKRRWIRIAPIYYVASFILLVLIIIRSPDYYSYKTIVKTITIIPLFEHEYWNPVIGIGWTLGFEVFFYILYAICIAIAAKAKTPVLLMAIIVLITLGVLLPGFQDSRWVLITNPISLEFCFGVAIALMYKSTIKITKYVAFAGIVIGCVLMVRLIFMGYGEIPENNYILIGKYCFKRVWLWGVPSAILVWGFVFYEKAVKKIFTQKWIIGLGNASYSIYLTHSILFLIVIAVLKRMPEKRGVVIEYGDLFIVALLLMASAAGLLFHWVVEKPLIKWLNKRFISKPSDDVRLIKA